MREERDPQVCEDCGRRFIAPTILDSGKCPICDGALVPLDQGPYPDPPSLRPNG